MAPLEWKNKKINLLDAPGLFDFEGGMMEAMRAADTVLVVISGKDGVAVGTEKAVAAAEKRDLAKIFFVNGLCDESARFYRVFEDLKAQFGPSVCPVVVPYIQDGQANIYINLLEYKAYDYSGGKPVAVPMPDMGDRLEGLRTAIYEAVAETDDELFEKYFAGESFTPEEVILGVSKGVKAGTITPVFCGDAMLMRGMEQFLDGLCWLAPTAQDKAGELGVDVDGNPVELPVNEDGAAAAIVFKTVADPFIGKLSYLKVISGKISTESQLINMRTGNPERVGKTVMMVGKKAGGREIHRRRGHRRHPQAGRYQHRRHPVRASAESHPGRGGVPHSHPVHGHRPPRRRARRTRWPRACCGCLRKTPPWASPPTPRPTRWSSPAWASSTWTWPSPS